MTVHNHENTNVIITTLHIYTNRYTNTYPLYTQLKHYNQMINFFKLVWHLCICVNHLAVFLGVCVFVSKSIFQYLKFLLFSSFFISRKLSQ